MPRHGGMPLNDNSTARQVGPVLDRSLLKSGIYILGVHKIWMCYLIYTQLPLNVSGWARLCC